MLCLCPRLRHLIAGLLTLAPVCGQPPNKLETVAEASNFTKTTPHADLLDFTRRCVEQSGGRLRMTSMGNTAKGRDLCVVELRAEKVAPNPLHVLIVANIHGGEVEGKEVAQQLLREAAQGQLDEMLQHLRIWVVPNFNPDGNDAFDKMNRVEQNGPDLVGRRENSAGLDLNRDLVKLETEEAQGLVALMNRIDAHVLMDLHTTNGSYHGYHLTYAPSLAVNMVQPLKHLNQRMLQSLQAELAKSGIRSFDYGNLQGTGEARRWVSFDHRPRYLTNYYGLRNRLAFLCEAYSYLPFARRVEVTHAYVHQLLRLAQGHREVILEACQKADSLVPTAVGYGSRLNDPVQTDVLVGSVDTQELSGRGRRHVARAEYEAVSMPVQTSFLATQAVAVPPVYAIRDAGPALRATLERHGIVVTELSAPWSGKGQIFSMAKTTKSRSSFQKHITLTWSGEWQHSDLELPAGTLLVATTQPRGRLAAQLLEPLSEDSLATWNHFDSAAEVGADGKAERPFPVVKLPEMPAR